MKDPDINFHSLLIHTSYFPRFGFCFPAKIFNAVDFPIPLVPTNPKTSPGRGIGNLLQYWGGGRKKLIIILKKVHNSRLVYFEALACYIYPLTS